MSGKLLLFLSLLISAIFVYFCVITKKDELHTMLQANAQTAAVTTDMQPTQQATQIQSQKAIEASKDSSLAYVSGDTQKIAGLLSIDDKNSTLTKMIEDICTANTCITEIEYLDNIKPFALTKETLSLINYAKKTEIKGFALYIDKGNLKIEGEHLTDEQLQQLSALANAFIDRGYNLDNQLSAKSNLEIEHSVATQNNMQSASNSINNLLQENSITFNYKSSSISKESEEILNRIVDILLGLDDVKIEVAGYTDSKGDAIYNKVLSQKRADSVRTYLIKAGISSKQIKSVGYGEENPISDPTDIINRRVEIHLKEGE